MKNITFRITEKIVHIINHYYVLSLNTISLFKFVKKGFKKGQIFYSRGKEIRILRSINVNKIQIDTIYEHKYSRSIEREKKRLDRNSRSK